MDATTKNNCAIRLNQVKDVATEPLEWLHTLEDVEFEAMWRGERYVPQAQVVKMEVLVEVAGVITENLANRVVSCKAM